MENLEELKELQKIAELSGDFVALDAINKKIYTIREQRREEKRKQRQQSNDNKTAEKIEKILTIGE